MEKGQVHIFIQRDASNVPFAKVYYNGFDAFHLDENAKIFAAYLARKSTIRNQDDGLVFVSTETGEVLDISTIDRLLDTNYCISGCVSGEAAIDHLLGTIICGANNKDIEVPVFVTDGVTEPIFINEREVSPNYGGQDRAVTERMEQEKYKKIDAMKKDPPSVRQKRI